MLKKRSLFPIVSMLLAMPTFSYADANSSASVTPIDNPIVLQRADPWLVRDDKTGCYTFIGTSPKFDEIELRQACRLNDLKLAEPKVIWHKNDKGPMSTNIWAPELHKVDGSWYIHFAAGDVEKPFSIRMFVLKNDSNNPMTLRILGVWARTALSISCSPDSRFFQYSEIPACSKRILQSSRHVVLA